MASRGVVGLFLLSALPLLCLELRRGIPSLGECCLPASRRSRLTWVVHAVPFCPWRLRAALTTIPRVHRARSFSGAPSISREMVSWALAKVYLERGYVRAVALQSVMAMGNK